MSTTRSSRPASAFVEALSEDDDHELAWVEMFCRKRGNEYLCEVTEDFLLDRFNLTHLLDSDRLKAAHDLITDNYFGEMDENGQIPASIQSAAKQLYGALHQRFIQTPSGLVEMQKKYTAKVYGCCPRVLCQGQALLPVGLSDKFSMDTVKLYCMRCEDIYVPKSTAHSQIDGAYFGTSLPQLFILSQQIRLAPYQDRIVKYVPKVFGFRIADPEVVARIDAKETHTMH